MYNYSEWKTDYTGFIWNNQFEYPILNMLLFNDMEFRFYIMQNPRVATAFNEFCIVVNEKNILETQEQFPTFTSMDGLDVFVSHPEHICGYCARYGEKAFGELIYNRKNDSANILLGEVLSDFCDAVGFDSFEQVQTYMKKCLFRQRRFEKKDHGFLSHDFDDLEVVFDDRMKASIEKYGDSVDEVKRKFSFVMYENAMIYHSKRIIFTDSHISMADKNRFRMLFFEQHILVPKPINTIIDDQLVVINRNDDISNLLFKLAVEIAANKLYIATGYMYRSGLEMLKPVFTYISAKEEGEIRLTIGALQNYRSGVSIKGMNRETADELNRIMDAGRVSCINTYENSFYHGKYYYITNGTISYLIVGSSNVTETAFLKIMNWMYCTDLIVQNQHKSNLKKSF